MWYYDAESMDCETFNYTGCRGNANRYSTKLLCEESCIRRDTNCSLSPETGPCRASIPRWYHNVTAKTCQLFIYGGCQGNQNNFRSFDSCMKNCDTICSLSPETGPCRASIPRWYYDVTAKTCQLFTYGGCQGNQNSFRTFDLCMKKCSVRPG
ncbi:hypothetical protein ScPMuIL_014810 [Solemya velum]